MKVLPESDLPLQKKEELIIPFTCIETVGEGIERSAYPDAIPFLEALPDYDAEDFFTLDALCAVETALAPYLNQHGYEREAEDVGRYYLTLHRPTKAKDYPTSHTLRLTAEMFELYENLTEFAPDYTDQIAYATLIDKKIVSLAAENPNSTPTLCEIYVETHPDYQGRGFALENTAALCQEKLQCGAEILYRCAADHAVSLHIAKKLGFTLCQRFYCHNAYRMEGSLCH